MSMRNRTGCILDRAGYDASLDPGNLTLPMGQPKAPPLCHCPPPQKARLGGMDPCIDLQQQIIRCRTCLKEVGPACRTRAVTHLRGLLSLHQTKPEHFDEPDCRDAGFLL